MAELASSIIGALIGGGLAALAAYWSVRATQRGEAVARAKSEQETVRALLCAFREELTAIFQRYNDTAAPDLEALAQNQPFLYVYPVVNDFFTIYNSNARFIGRIPDDRVRAQVVKTYVLAKGQVDSFRMNNVLVDKFERASAMFNETKKPEHQAFAQAAYQQLVSYAPVLKAGNNEVKQAYQQLMTLLPKGSV